MKSEVRKHVLKDLAETYRARALRVNPEYQRGTVWTLPQKQALIDSLLRGYQLPLFYVHLQETPNPFTKTPNVTVSLVDGQQRLAAIVSFLQNDFGLPDPSKESVGSVVPSLAASQPDWHGKRFEELPDADQKRLLSTELQVVEMREDRPNEVRDLFIRLQAGTPLTAQEKRDAWPGDFTRFVIRHAGKPNHPDSHPKAFFQFVKRGKKISVDDGDHYVDGLAETRKFFAGLAMTLVVRERANEDFVDLKGKTINEFYRENLDFPDDDPAAVRVRRVLDTVAELPGFYEHLATKPVSFQTAFHFSVLVDSLISGDYVPIWRDDLTGAFLRFQADATEARQVFKDTGESRPHHQNFVVRLSGSGSDTAEIIRRRHAFFAEKVSSLLRLKPKDPNRLFGTLERELIWNRDRMRCKACTRRLSYRETRIHHIVEHSRGGTTSLENGILVCNECHKDRQAMQDRTGEFQKYITQLSNGTASGGDLTVPSREAVDPPLVFVVDWRALGINRSTQTISEETASSSVAKLLFELIVAFGDSMKEQLTTKEIIRYPLSRDPNSFRTTSGQILGSVNIPGTDLHFCPHSDNAQKVRQLTRLFAGLTNGKGEVFPPNSIQISSK